MTNKLTLKEINSRIDDIVLSKAKYKVGQKVEVSYRGTILISSYQTTEQALVLEVIAGRTAARYKIAIIGSGRQDTVCEASIEGVVPEQSEDNAAIDCIAQSRCVLSEEAQPRGVVSGDILLMGTIGSALATFIFCLMIVFGG